MPWLSISLEVGRAHAGALSDALIDAGAISVSLEDAEAGTGEESALFAEPGAEPAPAWRRNRLVALAGPETDPSALVAAASAATGIDAPRFAVIPVPEQDWVRTTQAQFGPLRAGEHLWIVPSWHEPPVAADAIVVRLDPGLAFGTGSHASTRLVLAWLERAGCAGLRVLDYGCGSGILAIAAAKLGAAVSDGVDVDPQAIAAAASNAERNGVALRARLPDLLQPGNYDIVLANILANPLIVLAPLLAARCAAGGRIALSGILESQASEVMDAYAGRFELAVAGTEDGWVLLAGTRR
ncbi:MAG: 50S ribosomal protein L11 methyltransferase [Betaproteobacteria bacterium]|nr:50S ribosomal protein L11 methyltransferase [Betaproteobacteria bacterium]